jgi:hypothetical protein
LPEDLKRRDWEVQREKRVAGRSETKRLGGANGEETCWNILEKLSMGANGEEICRNILKKLSMGANGEESCRKI